MKDNSFLLAIVGCVAMHIFRELHKSQIPIGKLLEKTPLQTLGIVDAPYAYIKQHVQEAFGLDGLPEELYSTSSFADEFVTYDQLFAKVENVEQLLQDYGYDISFNLYHMKNDKVRTKIITTEVNTITATRLTSSVLLIKFPNTGVVRKHENTYCLLFDYAKGTEKIFTRRHESCTVILDMGKFMYSNRERIYCEKDFEELRRLLNVGKDGLTGPLLDGISKVRTCTKSSTKFDALHWKTSHLCKGCVSAFVKKAGYVQHVKKCVGGYQPTIEFTAIPHLEKFDEREFRETLLSPIVASFDTEASQTFDIYRRQKKDGTYLKSHASREAEMLLTGIVASVTIRSRPKDSYTLYKDVSMSDARLADISTVPTSVKSFISCEERRLLAHNIELFRNAMDDFMCHKEFRDDRGEYDECVRLEQNAIVRKKRKDVSYLFGTYFMSLFQACMEATISSVAVLKKKELNLTWCERVAFAKPIVKYVDQLVMDGIVRVKKNGGWVDDVCDGDVTGKN